jgi:hypothetical protein
MIAWGDRGKVRLSVGQACGESKNYGCVPQGNLEKLRALFALHVYAYATPLDPRYESIPVSSTDFQGSLLYFSEIEQPLFARLFVIADSLFG